MSAEKTSGGIGLCTIIFLIFMVLKLCKIGEVVDWSWWWVTSPLWIPFALVSIIEIPCLIVAYFLGR